MDVHPRVAIVNRKIYNLTRKWHYEVTMEMQSIRLFVHEYIFKQYLYIYTRTTERSS